MNNIINILHLSDLHFGDESITDSTRRKNVLDKLIDILKNEDKSWKPHLMVISGDIGWKGAKDDYQLAKEWLHRLLSTLELTANELITCVGNHDIDLDDAEFLRIPSDSQTADHMLKVENLKHFTSPFKEYEAFCMEMGMHPFSLSKEHSYLMGCREFEALALRFIVLNSAWFCRKDNMDKLWIGLPQLQIMESSEQLDDKNMMNIAVLHHPPQCLHDEETTSYGKRLNTYEYLSQHCSLVLSGHVHGVLKKCDQKYEHAFLFTGGSTYAGDWARNNFSLFQVDKKKGTVIRKPYEYDPENGTWIKNEIFKVVIDIKKGIIVKKEAPIEDFHLTLFNNSRKYYNALTGPNGRFKHLKIADIILPHSENEWIETHVAMGDAKEAEGMDGMKGDGDRSLNVLYALPMLWEKDCKHSVVVGEGGMGKTVSLIRLWEEYTKEYNTEKPLPIFIQLNEYNHRLATGTMVEASEASQYTNYIVSMIKENYLDASVTDADIWEVMKTPIKDTDAFVPSILLLLDGFNEITVEKRELLIELRKIIEQARGVQIIISSRYDMRFTFNWSEFNLLSLLKLENNQVESYLKGQNMPVPYSQNNNRQNRLWQLIKNPMMLTLYASTCEIEKIHKGNPNCDFKERVEMPGELLWNFMESQVARLFERVDKKEGEKWSYKFLLKFILPAIGYEMEKVGQFDLSREILNEIIETYCIRFSYDDFFLTFPAYERYEDELNLGEYSNNKERRRRRAKIIEILSEELLMMVNELDSFRFLHQNFRDFFAAVHILNEVSIGLKKNEVAEVLKERTIPIYLRRYLGEMEGEHYCKPVLIEGKVWEVNENKDSLLHRVLDFCRGCFDNSIGFAVWNIIEIWKEVRGELSGADLSRLDLSRIGFNGVRCSRFYKGTYLYTAFDHSLIHEKNIFSSGHSGGAWSAVYSPDRKMFLSASSDKTIKIWDIEIGECIKTFKGHSDSINSVMHAPCSRKILSASNDKTIKVWNIETGDCVKTYLGHSDKINSAVYSSDGKKILSASDDKTIKVWDVETGNCIKTYLGHTDKINSAVYSPDGNKILSASYDETIKEWEIESGVCINEINEIDGCFYMLTMAIYAQNSTRILGAAESGLVLEIDLDTHQILKELRGHSEKVATLVYSPNGKRILSASRDNMIKEWDAETGECLKTYKGHSDWVNSAVYSPDGKRILSTSCDNTIKEWDVETGECIKTLQCYSNTVFLGTQFSLDGKKILSSLSDSTIKEWNTETGECIHIYKGHSRPIASLAYRPDGIRILSVSLGETIKEWDVDSGKCIRTYDVKSSEPSKAIYSPDGKIILADYVDHTIREWSAENGKLLKEYPYPSFIKDGAFTTDHLKYSTDGKKFMAIYSDRIIKEWERDTGRCLLTYRLDDRYRYRHAIYSPDCQKIILISDKKIHGIDLITGRLFEISNKKLHYMDKNKFSPNGEMFVATKKDRIMIFNAKTGDLIKSIHNISGLSIQKCTFRNLHPDSDLSEESKRLMKQYGAIF